MVNNNSFRKIERLCSAKSIDGLFQSGKRLNYPPLRIIWKLSENSNNKKVKILISVPKKYFSKAIERNLIKRRIREAYRRNKNILLEVLGRGTMKSIDIAFIFASDNIIEYNEIENKIILVLQKISGSL